MNRIKALGLAICLNAMAACSHGPLKGDVFIQTKEINEKKAMELLRITDPERLIELPGGYLTSDRVWPKIKRLIGYGAGNVRVMVTKNGCKL